jgi:hypothetical protein
MLVYVHSYPCWPPVVVAALSWSPKMRLRKSVTMRGRPSRRGVFGSQPRSSSARVMSGLRLWGSSLVFSRNLRSGQWFPGQPWPAPAWWTRRVYPGWRGQRDPLPSASSDPQPGERRPKSEQAAKQWHITYNSKFQTPYLFTCWLCHWKSKFDSCAMPMAFQMLKKLYCLRWPVLINGRERERDTYQIRNILETPGLLAITVNRQGLLSQCLEPVTHVNFSATTGSTVISFVFNNKYRNNSVHVYLSNKVADNTVIINARICEGHRCWRYMHWTPIFQSSKIISPCSLVFGVITT